jgi:hypothetical protein
VDAEEDTAVLLHLLGVKNAHASAALGTPEIIKARAFQILSQISINLSRRRSLVLVLEDLHWIDKTSEEFLGFLAENTARTPILILATYRPGYHAPWLEKSYAGQTPLLPLSRADSIQMVRLVRSAEHLADLDPRRRNGEDRSLAGRSKGAPPDRSSRHGGNCWQGRRQPLLSRTACTARGRGPSFEPQGA